MMFWVQIFHPYLLLDMGFILHLFLDYHLFYVEAEISASALLLNESLWSQTGLVGW